MNSQSVSINNLVDIINDSHIIEWKKCLLNVLFTDATTTDPEINTILSNFVYCGSKMETACAFMKLLFKKIKSSDNNFDEIRDHIFEKILDEEASGKILVELLELSFGEYPDFVKIYKSSVRDFIKLNPDKLYYIDLKNKHPEFQDYIKQFCDVSCNMYRCSFEELHDKFCISELFDKFMFSAAAELNDLDCAKFLFENTSFCIHDVQYDAFKHFCLHNNIEAAQWIYSIRIPVKDWMNLSQVGGNPIFQNGEINIYYSNLFVTCCEKGFYDLVLWMNSVDNLKDLYFEYVKKDAIIKSCTNSYFNIANWIVSTCNYDLNHNNYELMRNAIESCNVPLINWLSLLNPDSYEKAKNLMEN